MAIEDNIAEEQQKLYSKLVLVVADDCQDSSDVEGADVDIRHLTFSSSYSPEHTHMARAGATEAGGGSVARNWICIVCLSFMYAD